MGRFIFFCIFIITFLKAHNGWGQVSCFVPPSSPQPVTKPGYTNLPIIYDALNFCYRFRCYGLDTITYAYYINGKSTFAAIKMEKGNTKFWPSIGGGPTIYVAATNSNVPGWSPLVSHSLLSAPVITGDTLVVNWKMKYSNNPVYDSVNITYKINLEGKTLIVRATANTPKCGAFYLDRSESTKICKVLPIPYMPGTNMLFTQGYFLTAFFDWEKTNGSEIYPSGSKLNDSSAYYGQYMFYHQRTNGTRNILNEKIYFTVSKDLDETLPGITGPLSPMRDSSAKLIQFDEGGDFLFMNEWTHLNNMKNNGLKNIWFMIHSWQRAGYDRELPDILPANPICGGNTGLRSLSDSCAKYGFKFSVHENYVDFIRTAPSYNPNDIARNPNGTLNGYVNYLNDSDYVMRPSVTASYMNNFSAQTHTLFNTNASYMDVHSAANPSYMVDYDSSIPNAGKFSETLNKYRPVGTLARSIHNGPVSGEGLFHYLYTGYYDDFEAQINCGKVDGTSFQYFQGMRMPLMVDFKLNKMHVQTPLHGVGLYERFFSRTDGNTPFHQRTIDSSMMYMATELAYGNCAYIPEHDRTKNLIKLAKLEYNYVYPVQKYIYNACPVSIMYNDNGIMRTASEYITKYPATYDSITSPDFLSQVKVTYSNGVIVWANRNRFKQWVVSTPNTTGTISVHALLSLPDSCYYGPFSQTTFTLMAQSGWLVHLPASLSSEINDAVRSEGLAITCYPNPFTEETSILITAEKAENGFIEIFNITGQLVYRQNKNLVPGKNFFQWKGETLSSQKCAKGLYFVKVRVGERSGVSKVVFQ